MPKNKAIGFVKQIQQVANDYAENFNKPITNASDYSQEYLVEQIKKNNEDLKKQIIKKVDILKNELVLHNRDISNRINEIRYPLLTKKLTNDTMLRGEQQVTNALLMYQTNFTNRSYDYLIEQLKFSSEDSDRREFFTTLLNQMVNSPMNDEAYQKVFIEVMKIKTEFENKSGIEDLNNAQHASLYGEKMSNVVTSLVDRNLGGFDIPEYQDKFSFEDSIQLSRLSNDSGIDLGEFTSSPGTGNTGMPDGE